MGTECNVVPDVSSDHLLVDSLYSIVSQTHLLQRRVQQ